MEDVLERLEVKIKSLIDKQDQLKKSNQHLFQGKSMLQHEKDLLVIKQQKAITQIETLVAKLKTIENLT